MYYFFVILIIQVSSNPISNRDVKIEVEVNGLGPKFLLRVSLRNTNNSPIFGCYINFSFNPSYYSMGYNRDSAPSVPVPVLLPGPKQIFETEIKCVHANGRGDSVLVIVSSPSTDNTATPLVSATVRMPFSELSI